MSTLVQSPSLPHIQDDPVYIPPAAPKFPHTKAQLAIIAKQSPFAHNSPKPLALNLDGYDSAENDVSPALLSRAIILLEEEREEELREFLREHFHIMDDELLEQNILDLMHKHRDDMAGIPFLSHAPHRRPISRPSSRLASHLDPPTSFSASAPSSPLGIGFKRPSLPLTSPLHPQTNPWSRPASPAPVLAPGPGLSPVLTRTTVAATDYFSSSLPASPLSSPRLLSADISKFKPIQRPLSAAATHPLHAPRSESPDPWATRATSNLAIAAPLLPDRQPLARSSSLRASVRPADDDADSDDDPFDPFAQKQQGPPSFPMQPQEYDWPSNSTSSGSSISPPDRLDSHSLSATARPFQPIAPLQPAVPEEDVGPEEDALLTDGMTPFDVLSSVFGASLAPSELEEALAVNSYDFERAMAWLVDKAQPANGQGAPGQRNNGPVVRSTQPGNNGNGAQKQNVKYVNGRPVPLGNRVCRYFVAGECLRSDCRFSHDLERALCRFWLRGTCAKNETCEFMHHLPKDVDPNLLNQVIARANPAQRNRDFNNAPVKTTPSPPSDEFPALGFGGPSRTPNFDPGRTRFAAAVKKQNGPATPTITVTGQQTLTSPQKPADPMLAAKREAVMGASAASLHHRSAIVAPRPSPRIRLRPPKLLPTLPTGTAVSGLYMAYRSRALQLGAARNACLSRAADAWRRGDGAAAKRFSREGHELNSKMSAEMKESARSLIRARAELAQSAVRARDVSWSDDAADRSARGKMIAGGLGVCLGISSREGSATPEERTEALLDLHALHSSEATEVLEEFLLSLEREHFYGLAYLIVGEEKHTGTQDVARGASRHRLATGVREWLHRWGYPWSERDGIICVDALTHES